MQPPANRSEPPANRSELRWWLPLGISPQPIKSGLVPRYLTTEQSNELPLVFWPSEERKYCLCALYLVKYSEYWAAFVLGLGVVRLR